MKRSLLWAAVLTFLGTLFSSALATAQVTHYVDNVDACSGRLPCHVTIMDAVNAAIPFDTIEVFPGVYHESVVFSHKGDIVLKAQSKARPPVIVSDGDAIFGLSSSRLQVLNFIIEAPNGIGVRVGFGGTSDVVIEGNLIKSANGIEVSPVVGGCTLRNNTVLGGQIRLGRDVSGCLVEGNTLDTADIVVCCEFVGPNVIRRNVVRGGGIVIGMGHNVGFTTVEGNFVSGSPGDGILVSRNSFTNTIQRNISIENSGCDINDMSEEPGNVWRNNRFATKCGRATE